MTRSVANGRQRLIFDGGATASWSYSARFRGRGYPTGVIRLGRSDEGMNRARAEHEARLIASQISPEPGARR